MKFKEENMIFGYYLMNAWMVKIEKVFILDHEQNNVRYLNTWKNIDMQITIPYQEIAKIKGIINNYKLFKIEKIESSPILDGTVNKFYFKNANNIKVIECNNLWYWQEDDTSKNAQILLDVFNEINDILAKYNINMDLNY